MEDRITRLETSVDRHDTQISKLFARIDETNRCIAKINTSLLQIKWSVYGALGYYVITQVGIIDALKVAL